MISTLDRLARQLSESVQEDPTTGVFRCRRDIFTDAELFALEMKHIFESGWVYLAHESQVPDINDYFTTYIGRQPVVITRDKQGSLHGLVNACAHRGAMLCRRKQGNKGSFTCPFHGWTFSNAGKLLKVKDAKTGAYPDTFDCDGSHDLKRLGRFENYRGFLFGSLSEAVPELSDYLGETRVIIDQMVDQAPEGLEVLRGSSSYTYDGNWKLQIENGADGYHVSSVHWNYSATMGRRNYEAEGTRTVDANGWSKSLGGVYAFEHGHILLWTRLLNPEVRPVHAHREALAERLGQERADFIVDQTRNLCLYPNVYLMDQFSTQIRVVRPLAVDKTEVTIYCMAPKGESARERTTRIRQYEDFFNVSGMGTPDDLEEFRACQTGYQGAISLWNDLSRGAKQWIEGADENARAMGMNPQLSGVKTEDEGLFVRQHAHWAASLQRAIELERQGLIATDKEVRS
ncbi:Rieske 2Fe-2S domain-containing protein [Pseudomonas brassicacearum subsp. neoaurantiaca]|jgi:Phenylpropionate dioxygenase and related ring-hydroxylating dioxygenases, large terminal subunit|uniref:2-chlorobenzoate 1,2-dioxygenase, alpha subunit n=1 Tax=Pseudomonas brassicacearum (strain NFM421) TaxID=994484 RepID=F2KHH4_PSEBN|nr:Rieske 2Fe-2S domain-containing protein [Pseudomonas brassicacearum]EIK65191.1 toluate 1,2-dioxygenase subunit alpha [Pseudomonas fluorescens Q8r1-96]AEA69180.1 2-chlorobenzoate 1,2-dioxygenase, alpha subunit [Pseudomonas brassicacearum subsp. brassicacearum NFM421]ALQ03723.1 Benzoate 1,2-dioxygenase alpha subunit [Pseudomonas brassicacearum]KAB0525875.1 Rieske 2Fe-2S domain-containing protein [Pseudomonas brassicacearum subsp. brassicacearum]NJP62589.1 Rieske 2Fe-2S domain-containing prote